MREVFEKYYTVRLFCQPDLHFAPGIKDIPGEFDTEEEARATAEPEWHKYDETNYAGKTYNWWDIQVMEHYKKLNPIDKEVRNLQRKVKRRDNKIIELEKKVKYYEKLLYKLGLRPLQIKFTPKGYLQEESNDTIQSN